MGSSHSGVVPLPGVRGDAAEVTLLLHDLLAVVHVQPLAFTITVVRTNNEEDVS